MPRQSPKGQEASSGKPAVIREMESIYAELENRPLERQCMRRAECCQFLATGRIPHLTRGEAMYAALGIRAGGRRKIQPHPRGACPLLDGMNRCTIHAHRPFGCRTHFCAAAGGNYPRRHVADLIQRLEALDEQMGGSGPRELENAVRDALAFP